MGRFKFTLLSFILYPLLSCAGTEPLTGNTLCERVNTVESSAGFKRDGGMAASFVVPTSLTRTNVSSSEGEVIRWAGAVQTITSSYFLRETSGPLTSIQCKARINGFDVTFARESDGERTIVIALFEQTPEPRYSLQLRFSDTDPKRIISVARQTVESVVFVGDWRELRVLSTSDDGKSFLYRNESGVEQIGMIGSTVTRTGGHVVGISRDSIRVLDLEAAGDGRWAERERTILVH